MAGVVQWEMLMVIAAVGAAVGSFMWWLSKEFERTRHHLNNHLTPVITRLDKIEAELVRLKVIVDGRH